MANTWRSRDRATVNFSACASREISGGEKFFELGFVEDGDLEGFRLLEFGAGVGADDHVVGFLADREPALPPCAATSASASSRERLASVPVKTKDIPANFELLSAARSSFMFTPTARRCSISLRFAGSEKNSRMPCRDLRADFA